VKDTLFAFLRGVCPCVVIHICLMFSMNYKQENAENDNFLQIYNCDVCTCIVCISHSMEELGDQCNVVFAGLLYYRKQLGNITWMGEGRAAVPSHTLISPHMQVVSVTN
jgi:hypothetical protein